MSTAQGTDPTTPHALAERLVAQRDALALLLGAEFPKLLVHVRARIRDHMTSLGNDNPFVAALDLAKNLDPVEDPYASLLLMAALDLHERENWQCGLPVLGRPGAGAHGPGTPAPATLACPSTVQQPQEPAGST